MKAWDELTNIQRAFVGIAFVIAAALLPEIAFLINMGGIELAFAFFLATFKPFLTWLSAKYCAFKDVVTITYIAYRQSASANPAVFAVQASFCFAAILFTGSTVFAFSFFMPSLLLNGVLI
jgi:hypothetical protein